MPILPDQPSEHPSTYFMPDRSNEEEMYRLRIQDHMATLIMGGLVPEQTDPTRFRRVLDVACGTGGWLVGMAKTFPNLTHLIGVDISGRMLEVARAQAREQGVEDRVEFLQMDALRMLEFPNEFFDLVNQRFAMSYLRTWDWRKLLLEFERITRSPGIIRLTESNLTTSSSSPALVSLFQQLALALAQAGHLFALDEYGIADHLAPLLQQYAGLRNIKTRVTTLEYRAEEEAGRLFAEDMRHAFRTSLPFIQKWTRVPSDYEAIYQQMDQETRLPSFDATAYTITAWGSKEE